MLVPKNKLTFSKYGSNSLYVYLWHGFFIKILTGIGFITLIGTINTSLALIALLLTSLVITLILSTDLIAKSTQKLLLIPTTRLILTNLKITSKKSKHSN
jgi:fucose 4-O-acetylase-like acetyltransferase